MTDASTAAGGSSGGVDFPVLTVSTLTGRCRITGDDGASIASIFREAGFSGVEGCIPLVDGLGPDRLGSVGRVFHEQGVGFHSFHLPYTEPVGHDLASLYETERRRAVAETIRWIRVAALLDVQVGIVHPTTKKGYSVDIEGFERILDAFTRSMEDLLLHAEDCGMIIAVENVPPAAGVRFGSLPGHLDRIRSRLGSRAFGFCLDTGHALLSCLHDPLAFYDTMGDDLVAFHLTDNAGDRDSHLAPGRGLFPWQALALRLTEHAPRRMMKGSLCIEAPPFAPGEPYSPDSWKRLRSETQNLLFPDHVTGDGADA